MRTLLLLASALCLAACGGPRAEERTTVTTVTSAETTSVEIMVRSENGYRVEGSSIWEGRYVCPQGVTGLTLELTGAGGSSVNALFRFYAVPENPGVPSGAYTMTGVVRGDGTIDLTPGAWLEQPYGYIMVGMTGVLDRASGVMRGAITNPGCAAFDLRRVR